MSSTMGSIPVEQGGVSVVQPAGPGSLACNVFAPAVLVHSDLSTPRVADNCRTPLGLNGSDLVLRASAGYHGCRSVTLQTRVHLVERRFGCGGTRHRGPSFTGGAEHHITSSKSPVPPLQVAFAYAEPLDRRYQVHLRVRRPLSHGCVNVASQPLGRR